MMGVYPQMETASDVENGAPRYDMTLHADALVARYVQRGAERAARRDAIVIMNMGHFVA